MIVRFAVLVKKRRRGDDDVRDIGKTKERKSDILGTHWSWIQESLEGRVNFEKGGSEKLRAIFRQL